MLFHQTKYLHKFALKFQNFLFQIFTKELETYWAMLICRMLEHTDFLKGFSVLQTSNSKNSLTCLKTFVCFLQSINPNIPIISYSEFDREWKIGGLSTAHCVHYTKGCYVTNATRCVIYLATPRRTPINNFNDCYPVALEGSEM